MNVRACSSAVIGVVVFFGLCHPVSAQKLIGQVKTFPIVISKPGSYKLRSNLTVPDANTTAISITADNVTIDLNGFSILGPTVCSGGPPVTSCTPTGTGNGIDSRTSFKAGTTVVNGTVQGMGQSGLSLGPRARVERVRAVSNGACGILTGWEATILNNTTGSNGDTGIRTGWEATVVSGNVAEGNTGNGIEGGTTTTNNTAVRNGCDGIDAGDGATVLGNSAAYNGCAGLHIAGGEVGYGNNVFRTNTFGSVFGGGTDLGHNDCNGSTTCP